MPQREQHSSGSQALLQLPQRATDQSVNTKTILRVVYRCFWLSWNPPEPFTQLAQSQTAQAWEAVSYTHLDVYKRQSLTRRRTTLYRDIPRHDNPHGRLSLTQRFCQWLGPESDYYLLHIVIVLPRLQKSRSKRRHWRPQKTLPNIRGTSTTKWDPPRQVLDSTKGLAVTICRSPVTLRHYFD